MRIRIGEFAATAEYFRGLLDGDAYSEMANAREPGWLGGAWDGLGKALRALGLAGADPTDEKIVLACAKTAKDLSEMGEIGEMAGQIRLRINVASSPIDRMARALRELPEAALGAALSGLLASKDAPWGRVAWEMAKRVHPAREAERRKNNGKRAVDGLLSQSFRREGDRIVSDSEISIGTGIGRDGAKKNAFAKEMLERLGPEGFAQAVLLHELGHALCKERRMIQTGWHHGHSLAAAAEGLGEEDAKALRGMGAKLLGPHIRDKATRKKIERAAGIPVGETGWGDAERLGALWEECMADSMAAMLSRNLGEKSPGEYPGFGETLKALRESRDAQTKQTCAREISIHDHGTEHALDELQGLAAKLPQDRHWSLEEMLSTAEIASARAVSRAILASEKLLGPGREGFLSAQEAVAKTYGKNGEILAREDLGGERETLDRFRAGLRSLAGPEWVGQLERTPPPKVDLGEKEATEETFGRIGAALWAAMSTPPGIPWKWRLGEGYAAEGPSVGLSEFRSRRQGIPEQAPKALGGAPSAG